MAQNNPNNHPEPQQTGVLSRSLLNVLLVFIESAITLMLRFDPKLRQLAYPLAESGKVVCIRTYLPHTTIYATFGYRGILLDDTLPANKTAADIVINAYSFQLVNALMKHSTANIDALQIRGDAQDVEQLRAFLVRVGVGGAIQNIIHKIKGEPKTAPTAQEKAEKLADLRNKIAEQSQQIDTLQTDNRRLSTQLSELQSKQKTILIGFISSAFIAIVSIILHFVI